MSYGGPWGSSEEPKYATLQENLILSCYSSEGCPGKQEETDAARSEEQQGKAGGFLQEIQHLTANTCEVLSAGQDTCGRGDDLFGRM